MAENILASEPLSALKKVTPDLRALAGSLPKPHLRAVAGNLQKWPKWFFLQMPSKGSNQPRELDTDDMETLLRLIDHKVRHAGDPLEVTCHLNDDIEPETDAVDNAFSLSDGEGKCFVDMFFRGSKDIRAKLGSLMSPEWSEEERNCFYRIFLTAATREKRHDIVDMILHILDDMDAEEIHRLLTYAVANHEDETFRKTPLQWAVENHDEFSLIELLRKEREYHEDKEDGLYCLKYQLTNDLNLNLAISQFDGLYEKSACDKRLEVLPILIPLLISFVLYCTDVRYDITLSIQYRNLSQTVTSVPANDTVCFHRTTTPEMYGFAFMWTIAFACSSVVVASFIFMASKTLRPLCNNLWRRSRLRFALMLPLLLCPPLFLFAVYLVYAYRHGTSSKKSKERDNLELAEFLWTIVDIVEAGFEASGEIILQVWLLGPNILDIKDMGISELISGILFLEDSTVTQKSIGVIIIAVLSIVYCVGECYRVQKREAVNMFFDIIPIYISFLLQVVARIIAFSMFFSTSISANPDGHQGTYIFLALHISAVFLIKLRFSRHWRSDKIKKGRYEIAVMVFTDFASAVCSCLVYCDIRPMSIERRKRVEDEEGTTGPVEDIVAKAKEDHKLNTTFFTHFYFLLLVFVENIILTCWPHITNDDCVVDVTSLTALLFVVITLTVVSGLCNIFYYKVSGHPWAALNGIPVKMRFREIQSRTLDFFHLGCCKKTSVSVHGGELEARMPDEANEVRLELKPEETMGDGSPS